jgi:hypothetical protein
MSRNAVALILIVAVAAGVLAWRSTRKAELWEEPNLVFELRMEGKGCDYTYRAKGRPDGTASYEAITSAPRIARKQGELTREQWVAFLEGFEKAYDAMNRAPSTAAPFSPGTMFHLSLSSDKRLQSQDALNDAQANPLLQYVDKSVVMTPFRQP